MFDILIKGGKILDGSGSDYFVSDIAIKDGKIVLIKENIVDEAGEIIDATGLFVTPGFVDSHSHADTAILEFPESRAKIEQGITTSIGGQCGSSAAPLGDNFTGPDVSIGNVGKKSEVYKSFKSYSDAFEKVKIGANLKTFIGHSAIRKAVVGYGDDAPTKEQLEQMKELVRQSVRDGALGISYGLIYSPSCYSTTDELVELARAAVECGGMISAHIRNESDTLVEAVSEFLEIIEKSGARGVISHHKASKKQNWGKVKTTIKMIEDARARGLDVYCDVYPYIASNTSLTATFVPPAIRACDNEELVRRLSDEKICDEIKQWLTERGMVDLSYVFIAYAKNNEHLHGLYVNEAAEKLGLSQHDTVLKLIRESNNSTAACYFTMCEEDVETVIAYKNAMICTDSGHMGKRTVFHPRLRASFPRAIAKYVRERGVVTLPEMIRKMTSLPAKVYDLKGKGYIREGYDADICIFDYEKIKDNATFTTPTLSADGLNFVILAGKIAVRDAKYTGAGSGKILLRGK